MVFHTGAALLDAIVLAVVSMEETGTYGYRITQDVRKVIDVSESTLYPVLRRLQKDECLPLEFPPYHLYFHNLLHGSLQSMPQVLALCNQEQNLSTPEYQDM